MALQSMLEKWKGTLVPTSSSTYTESKERYRESYQGRLDRMELDLKCLRKAVKNCHEERQRMLRRIDDYRDSDTLTSGFSVAEYAKMVKRSEVLRRHLKEAEEDFREFQYHVATQASMDLTGYHGFEDWSKTMLSTYSAVITILITISTVGSSLVYATVFSATRGDIGLMAFSFPLFTVGFLVPVFARGALKWASGRPRDAEFASQRFWTVTLMLFLFISALCTVAAMTILNVTVFILPRADDTNGSDEDNITDVLSRIPGIVLFGLSSLIILFILVAFLATCVVRGWRTWFFAFAASKRADKKLEEYSFA